MIIQNGELIIMDKQRAEEIIAKCESDGNFICYPSFSSKNVQLDGDFSADELEAIVWVMRNSK